MKSEQYPATGSNVILCILDGFGTGDKNYQYNAVFQAKTPNFQRFLKEYPNAMLETSGLSVGLPTGQMGNSEVGHMTIGSGRILFQDLPRIDNAIKDSEMLKKLENIFSKNENPQKTIHIVGLCSDGGVHSSLSHIKYIYKTLAQFKYNVVLHIVTDGRDVAPNDFLSKVGEFDDMKIGTVAGRFFAMDRDKKLERTRTYFDALLGKCKEFDNLKDVIENSYNKNISDEFIDPCKLKNFDGIKKGDLLFMANFRADRARQITTMAIESEVFEKIICMTEYSKEISQKVTTLFEKYHINNTLVDILERNQKTHLHIAETEKYAHVTFFFNGGKEELGEYESRILVQSPSVKTYDEKPEMSLPELQDKLMNEIASKKHNFIVINIANGDMVGHTGSFDAAKKAAESVDTFLGVLEKSSQDNDYHLLITADHGNLEEMIDRKTNEIHTQHTTLPVPIIYIGRGRLSLKNGTLADIAPMVLNLMQLPIPDEMKNLDNNN